MQASGEDVFLDAGVCSGEVPGPRLRLDPQHTSGVVAVLTPTSPTGLWHTHAVDFDSVYAQGYARVAACTIPTVIADPHANATAVLESARAAHDEGVVVAVFPELALTGYSIEDLFLQEPVVAAVGEALEQLARESVGLPVLIVVGAPLRHGNRVLNAAVVIHGGQVLGVAPKSYLPTYREFYERRHFAPGDDRRGQSIVLGAVPVPLGPDLLFRARDLPDLVMHVEVCEDMWVPVPPS